MTKLKKKREMLKKKKLAINNDTSKSKWTLMNIASLQCSATIKDWLILY
jgi:hypothetical protein